MTPHPAPPADPAPGILPDLALALIAVSVAMAIVADEDGGSFDGRHLLAIVCVALLIIRTITAARRG